MTGVKRGDDVLRGVQAAARARCRRRASAWSATAPTASSVEQLAGELGIVRHCLFPGYQEEVGPFFAAFDVFVLPSGNEGTPVTAIEALASGCPVVATRVGGVPDVVRDGEDGFLVEPGAVDELAERLGAARRRPRPARPDGRRRPRARGPALRRRAPRSTTSTASTASCSREGARGSSR